jgi:hypothetical protein
MAQHMDHSDRHHNSFFHGMHVIAHGIRVAFDAINHSGGASFIYPMIGVLIFLIIMAIRHRDRGDRGGGGGGGSWDYSPSPAFYRNYK